MKLDNKVVLLTGASSGIGALAAQKLAAAGAQVVLAARSLDKLEAIAATLPGAMAVQLDVTDDESVHAAVAAAMARHGRIDVLINNAGNGGALSLFLATATEHTRATFDVHVFGMERMTRAVLPIMLQQNSGTIMNVVSTVGYVPMPSAAAYCAAKAAIIAFTEALRGEIGESAVKIALYSPPHTQTDAGKEWPLDLPKQFSPDFAAEHLVRTLIRDKRNVLAGGNGTLLWLPRAWALSIMRGIGLKALAQVKRT